MSQPPIEYEPSPAHKYGTTAVGPPTWNPSKEKCPEDLTVSEREELLRQSFARDGRGDNPRRYALRRAGGGTEFYESKLTVVQPDGTIVVHGHPTLRGRTRSTFAWVIRLMSATSSRKSVPPLAISKRPRLRDVAPVKAPFS